MDTVGYGMTQRLADKNLVQTGVNWADVGFVELHDCFAVCAQVTAAHRDGADYFFCTAHNLSDTLTVRRR